DIGTWCTGGAITWNVHNFHSVEEETAWRRTWNDRIDVDSRCGTSDRTELIESISIRIRKAGSDHSGFRGSAERTEFDRTGLHLRAYFKDIQVWIRGTRVRERIVNKKQTYMSSIAQ